jgi:hypothetical protein
MYSTPFPANEIELPGVYEVLEDNDVPVKDSSDVVI